MPSRAFPFVNDEYYHVFNRGVAHMPIFNSAWNYQRFLKSFIYYQIDDKKPKFSRFDPRKLTLNTEKKIVEVVCYCFMPNHFHFLLRQIRDNGITEFVGKLSNSYTKYFNVKNKRDGPLLQGEFKAVRIETNEQLIHVSRYIHLNPLVGYMTNNLDSYPWSSYGEYIAHQRNPVCQKDVVLDQFKSSEDYASFVKDQESYAKELDNIKHLLFE